MNEITGPAFYPYTDRLLQARHRAGHHDKLPGCLPHCPFFQSQFLEGCISSATPYGWFNLPCSRGARGASLTLEDGRPLPRKEEDLQ